MFSSTTSSGFEMRLGEIIRTRKPHPCGSDRWEIVRIGADIKIRCLACGRVVMLTPDELKKRMKSSGKEN